MKFIKGVLLGAGFSYDLGMPLGYELTGVFLDFFSEKRIRAFIEILSRNDPYSRGRPINKKAIIDGFNTVVAYKENSGSKNYESLLLNIQKLGNSPEKTQSDKDSYSYLFSVFYEIIFELLTHYQIESYNTLYTKNFKCFSGLTNMLSAAGETWIFTLNHDLYLECLAVDLGIPITYGDLDQIIFPINNIEMKNKITFTCSNRDTSVIENRFFANIEGINLVKLHGGLGELEYKDRKIICNQSLSKRKSLELLDDFKKIVRMSYYYQGTHTHSLAENRFVTNPAGELDVVKAAMLTGGRKYSLTTNPKTGEEKLKLFDDALKKLNELTIIGYGFKDDHINYRISNAMVLNSNLKLRIVDPASNPTPEFLRQFGYDNRVLGAMCCAASWMDYSGNQKWNHAQLKSLKDNAVYRDGIRKKVEAIMDRAYCC